MEGCNNIDFDTALALSSSLRRRTFWANPFFLMQNCFVKDGILFEKRGNSQISAVLFFPDCANITNNSVGIVFEEELPLIERQYSIEAIAVSGVEFLYSSDEWADLGGSKFSGFRRAISGLLRRYSVDVFDDPSTAECTQLVETWALCKQQAFVRSNASASDQNVICFEEEVMESFQALRIVESLSDASRSSIGLRVLGLRADDQLIGFCIIFNLLENFWIAFMQKTNFKYGGASQLLFRLQAQLIGPGQIITTGGDAYDANLRAFKESLRPICRRSVYTVELGGGK